MPDRRSPLHVPVTFKRTATGLFVPESVAETARKLPPAFRFAATMIGYRDVTGHEASLTRLLERLEMYSLEAILIQLSRIALVLGSRTIAEDNASTQALILDRYLGDGASDQVVARAAAAAKARGDDFDRESAVFFHERQLLNLAKIALLHLKTGIVGPVPPYAFLLDALLMLNDLMDAEVEQRPKGTPEGERALALHIFANAHFHQGGHAVHDLVRGHYLYLASHPEVTSSENLPDIPELINEVSGIEPNLLGAVLFVLFGRAFSFDLEELDAGSFAIPRSFFSTVRGVNEDVADRYLRLAATSLEEMQEAVRGSYSLDDLRFFDILVFEKYPMVMWRDNALCLSVGCLAKLAGPSLGHRVLGAKLSKSVKTGFSIARGRVFDLYCSSICERMVGPRFVGEASLKPLMDGRKVCDGVIDCGDSIILLEFKSRSPLFKARTGEDFLEYERSFDEEITDAADQFESTIGALEDGRLTSLGLDPDRIHRIYPIIVFLELAVEPLMYHRIMRDVLGTHALKGRIGAGRVGHLQLFDIGDLEYLELIAEEGRSVAEEIAERANSLELTVIPVFSGLIARNRVPQKKHGDWYAEQYFELATRVEALLKTDDADAAPEVHS